MNFRFFNKVLLISTLAIISLNANSFWVISNSNIESDVQSEISNKNDLLLIFSLKKTQWENGSPIIVVTLASNNKIHQDFVNDTLGLNYNILENIWNIKIHSGNVNPPITVKSKEAMIEYIKNHKGSIGYIYSNNVPGVYSVETNELFK